MSTPKNYTHSPEQLTLREDGLWSGVSGQLYALTWHAGKTVWVEIDDNQNAVRVARKAVGDE